jgi:hypothetical protein
MSDTTMNEALAGSPMIRLVWDNDGTQGDIGRINFTTDGFQTECNEIVAAYPPLTTVVGTALEHWLQNHTQVKEQE